MLRVTIPDANLAGRFHLVPDQYPFYPKVLLATDGLPAYGQVFLSESLGSMFFVMVYLTGKFELERGKSNDPFGMIVCIIMAWIGLYTCFEGISGGIFNPALALAQIVWQNLTYMYAYGPQQRYWTFEYGLGYIIAPFMGGFMAGNIFNRIKDSIHKIEGYHHRKRTTVTTVTTDRGSTFVTKEISFHEET